MSRRLPRRVGERRAATVSLAALFALAGTSLLSASASAQTFARRDVPRGEVSGLEMGIEGNLATPPGGRVRWFVTVYEIVGGRNLRPAPKTALRVLASFRPSEPVVETVTDENGRAAIDFEVPGDLEQPFDLQVEARSPKRVMRTFEVTVQLAPRYRTELFVDRATLPPGATLRVWGRVLDLVANRPSVEHSVNVRAKREQFVVGRGRELETDAQGMFRTVLRVPDQPGPVRVEALAEKSQTATRSVEVALAPVPKLVVYARPERSLVAPGTTVAVDVVVRTPDGRPVPRATLTGLSIPERESDEDESKIEPVLTDARGRARVPWEVKSSAQITDVAGELRALREGIGTGRAEVRVRVARGDSVVTWAVEGGALVPGLRGRVFVKLFRTDGTPWPGRALALRGGRLDRVTATTDGDGVAVFETAVADRDRNPTSACHGPTVAAATLEIGDRTQDLCLPVDPDATLTVRSEPTVLAGGKLDLRLSARASVVRAPVAVTVLSRGAARTFAPVAQRVVPAATTRVSLAVPPEAVGPLWIRARPLIGGERQVVRGGGTLVWSAPRHDLAVRVTPSASGAMKIDLAGARREPGAGFVLALPLKQGEKLLAELERARGAWPGPGVGVADQLGFLASRTPVDSAVPAVLRDGRVVVLAMPSDAVEQGLLRDPWRSRSRFVRGRLGRLLLALEDRVEQSIPDNLEDVAVRGARGWRLNSEILAAIAEELGADAITGLDGSPLTIPALQALDRNIDYDHVARRLTRERLLSLLVALREFVQQNQLDYEWARRGEPESWLSALIDWTSPDGELTIDRSQLFDGWGRPFAIRRARGARARFRFLEPVVGYELISAGPDGRFGNGDDVFDPFARVLPANSTYGAAVGEEALLRRLRGVELGRATIAMLQEAFGVAQPSWESESSTASRQPWAGPRRLVADPDALAARAIVGAFPAAAAFRPLPAGSTEVDLGLAADPHLYLVVAGAYASDGEAAFDAERLRAGVPVLVDVTLPERLRPHEPLAVPLHLVGLEGRREIRVEAKGGGPISVAAQGAASFALAEGEERTVELQIEASGVGSGSIHLRILTANGRVLRRSTHRVQVMWDGSLRAQHAGVVVDERAAIGLRPPAGTRAVRSFLVVTAPRDVMRDPGFDELRGEHPALLAWAYSLRGAPLSPSLKARLAARPKRDGPMPVLEAACAAVAWSSLAENEEHEPHLSRAVARLQGLAAPASMRERSALLVALSTSAALITHSDRGDPVAALVGALREDGWHAPLTEKNRPTVMARMAAGLLLADRRDVPGRELFNRARAALVDEEHRGKVLKGEEGRALDGWIGTVALAIAARQLGEDALARQLIRGLAPRLYLGMEGGFEAGFWLLAASAYGVFGIDAPPAVALKINGSSKRLDLAHGVATLALPDGKVAVEMESPAPVVARLEARYVRPVTASKHAPLSGVIEGHVGHVGDTAALEVTVRSHSEEVVARPVVEIMLPSAAALTESARSALLAAEGVTAVEGPDGQGSLRIYLSPLEPLQQRRLPLPLRWIGRGRVEGLSIVLFDADRPWVISATPSRTTELRARPKESWQ